MKEGDSILKEQCYGVEIELTGITRKQAADVLAELFGTTSRYIGGSYDAYTVKDPEGKEWKTMNDASITPQKRQEGRRVVVVDGTYKVELVTPKLTYEEMEKLQSAIRCMRKAGGFVNESCGIHVHIDGANHTQKSLKNLLSIMYAKEDILFHALQVNEARAREFCQKVREPMLQRARRLSSSETTDLTQLEHIWYGSNRTCMTRRTHYHHTRYYALNLHSMFYRGTVEFRMFNSTLHAGEVRAYVTLCLAMSAQAIAQRGTVLRKTQSDNEKFTFRTWLIRLGLNGEEFKAVRKHLLKHLDGDPSWRYERSSYACNQRPRNIER